MTVWGATWYITWLIALAWCFMGLAIAIFINQVVDKQKKKALRAAATAQKGTKQNTQSYYTTKGEIK